MKDRVKFIFVIALLVLALNKANNACCPSPTRAEKVKAPEAEVVAQTVSIFSGRSLPELMRYLDGIRPKPVGAQEKQDLFAGVVRANARVNITDQRRVSRLRARVEAALRLHHRSAVVEMMIFKHPSPAIVTKPGVVIAVSDCLLDLIGDDDAALLGLISHELAHEYVAGAFYDATQLGQKTRLQELELFCDAVAVASLAALELDPARYARILQKMVDSTPGARRLNDGSTAMPAMEVRLKLIGQLKASLQRHVGK